MSIQSEIERIEGNIADTYTALSSFGADMPDQRNSDNLPGAAESVKAVLYSAQTLTEEQKSQARENIGAEPLHVPTDEELIESGYVLQDSDLIRGAVWVANSTTSPVAYPGAACTRKFNVSFVPMVSWSDEVNCSAMQFWKNGAVVKEVYFTVLKETWEVDIDFDQVTFNVTYGGPLPADVMDIKVEKPESHLFKKVLVIGDSISTDYYGNYTKWVTMLTDEGFFPADTTNDSIHATGFVARYNNEANDFLTRIASVTNKESYELVVVFGGVNDFIQAVPLGGGTGETDATVYFKPAVDSFFDYLMSNFTQARLVVLLPLRTYHRYPNTAGFEQSAYSDYIHKVAKSYSLPVLNLTDESGFYPVSTTFSNMWTFTGWTGGDGVTGDGVHPNEEYQRNFLAPMIEGFLLNIKPSVV